MSRANRTRRTIQNGRMSLLLFIVQVIVGFYSRKVFLDYLGAEVLGLNTTLGNILSFLNLAELGIGIAMATSLYKPIHDENQEAICEILTVQGSLYRKIAMLLCALSVPILIALPFIFPNTSFSIWYVYLSFVVFLSGSIFSYLWNYRTVLIQADQKNYKLMPWTHGMRYGKLFLQIIALIWLGWGIWGWILLELAGNIATVFIINHVIHKEYPWLKQATTPVAELLKKHKIIITKTKQLFVHKITQFIVEQTSPLIIYAYVSLTMVTYYANYMLLIGYTATLMNVIFEGMGASIGNLVAEDNKKHTLEVFWELFTSRLWIAAVACFAIYVAIEPFITLWIGPKYLLPQSTLLLLVATMFIRLTRSVVDSFKNAYQLFADVWAPIVEGILHLGCSLLFGWMWGLNGVLIGVIISQVVIVLLWKPYYTFREGMKASSTAYFVQYALHCALLMAAALAIVKASVWAQSAMGLHGWPAVITMAALSLAAYTIATFAALYILTPGMRHFTTRLSNIIHHRI